MKFLPRIRWGGILLLTAFLAGCGYSASRLLPAEYQTIYVEPFRNRIDITREVSELTGFVSNIPELEEDVTQGVIERFLFDGNLRVTSERGTADLVLDGELTDFYRQALRRLDNETVEEYRLNLVASLVVTDRAGKTVLEEPALIADATYFVTGSSAVAESVGVQDLVTDFSRRVVEWVIEYW